MNFSDDEDFFERAGEDEDDLLPFEGYECYQPPEEMPPEGESRARAVSGGQRAS